MLLLDIMFLMPGRLQIYNQPGQSLFICPSYSFRPLDLTPVVFFGFRESSRYCIVVGVHLKYFVGRGERELKAKIFLSVRIVPKFLRNRKQVERFQQGCVYR